MLDLIIPNEKPIVTQPTVINVFGQTGASLLSKLKYWMNRATKYREGKLWVYKTVEEWGFELHKSTATIERAIKLLEDKGVLISRRFESSEWYQGKSYRIDIEVMYGLLGMPVPSEDDFKFVKPVDKLKQNDGIDSPNSDGIITRKPNTFNTPVCMDLSTSESDETENVKEEFWKDEDWPLVKALGDSRVDPESPAGITFASIAKELKVSADQLRSALDTLFNAKFHIKNPFGFVKKVLRDLVSGESAYFNYHYSKGKIT